MPGHVLEGGEGDKNEVLGVTEGEHFSCIELYVTVSQPGAKGISRGDFDLLQITG